VSGPALVTGGSGVVGRALIGRLVADGREVRALARSEESERTVRLLGAHVVRGDVLDPTSLRAAAEGCTTVFHVAGINALCMHDPRPMVRTNVEGSVNTVRASADAGVERLVYTSSSSTIGESPGTVGREDSPHRGWYLSEYERSKHLAELRVFEVAGELGVQVVAVNPASVQGPGRATGSARLLLDVVNGRLPVLVETTISLVDIGDCSAGHLLAETRGRPGERYLLSGSTITTREAVELLERIWGLRREIRFGPSWLAKAGGTVIGAGARLLRRDAPVCPEAVRTLLHGHRYDGSKATRELGLRYTPLEVTLLRTLEWCAAQGLVRSAPGRRART
jgi:dihydroflavonol-4-reductase